MPSLCHACSLVCFAVSQFTAAFLPTAQTRRAAALLSATMDLCSMRLSCLSSNCCAAFVFCENSLPLHISCWKKDSVFCIVLLVLHSLLKAARSMPGFCARTSNRYTTASQTNPLLHLFEELGSDELRCALVLLCALRDQTVLVRERETRTDSVPTIW
jgi:hypothetical protein